VSDAAASDDSSGELVAGVADAFDLSSAVKHVLLGLIIVPNDHTRPTDMHD